MRRNNKKKHKTHNDVCCNDIKNSSSHIGLNFKYFLKPVTFFTAKQYYKSKESFRKDNCRATKRNT